MFSLFSGFDSTMATTTDGKGSPIPRTGSPDRTRSRSVSPLRRNLSPSRAALDESVQSAAEVDPEAVRLALRDYVTLMASTERERDDAQAAVRNLSGQLGESNEERARVEERLATLQKSLLEVEENKRGLDGRYASAQTALMMQEETIRREYRSHSAGLY